MHRRSFLTAAAGLAVAQSADGADPGNQTTSPEDFRGRARSALPTPALLLDLAAFEANLRTLAEHCKKAGCGFRPHAKTHKCPELARRQVASGALGVCVATVPEAEAMVQASICGVLLTSPVLEPGKVARRAALAKTGEVLLTVGHTRQVEWLDEAARKAGATVDVLIDLDVGDRRTGVSRVSHILIHTSSPPRVDYITCQNYPASLAAPFRLSE